MADIASAGNDKAPVGTKAEAPSEPSGGDIDAKMEDADKDNTAVAAKPVETMIDDSEESKKQAAESLSSLSPASPARRSQRQITKAKAASPSKTEGDSTEEEEEEGKEEETITI